jgi:hypothetical protein
MTSLSTWLRAAIGSSSRRGGFTRAPMLAGRRRTRKAGLPGHAIPRPGPPLSLPWSSSPASPDESAQRADEVAVDRAYRGCPFADGASRLACPGQPGRRPGGRRPLHQRPLGPGAGAPYPPDTGSMLVAGAATPAAHEQGDLCARAHGRHGSPTPDSADVSEFRLRILMQRSASPFVISKAVRDTWLSTGTRLLGGPDRRLGAPISLAGSAMGHTQIGQLWVRWCDVAVWFAAGGASEVQLVSPARLRGGLFRA